MLSIARFASPMFFIAATEMRSVPFFSYTLKRLGCVPLARDFAPLNPAYGTSLRSACIRFRGATL